MEKYGVSLIPRMVHGSENLTRSNYSKIKEFADKTGNITRTENTVDDFVFTAQMEMVWVNDEDPDETVVVPWIVIGQQSNASMAFGSGLTYTSRYFLLKYFNVATSEDDPDYYLDRKADTLNQEQRQIVDAIIAQIESVIAEKVNDSNKAAVKKAILEAKIVTENGRASNKYNLIKDAESATAYLNVLQKAVEADAELKKTNKESK